MAFAPRDAVEPLDFDFRPDVDAHGTVPEPMQADLDAFYEAVRQIGRDESVEHLAAVESGDDAREALASLDEDLLTKLTSGLAAAVALLCKGCPTEDEINALPVRYRQAFISWVIDETTNPTKRSGASRPAVVRSRGVAPSI